MSSENLLGMSDQVLFGILSKFSCIVYGENWIPWQDFRYKPRGPKRGQVGRGFGEIL